MVSSITLSTQNVRVSLHNTHSVFCTIFFKHVFADYNYNMRLYDPSQGSVTPKIEHASGKEIMRLWSSHSPWHEVTLTTLHVSLSLLVFKLEARINP
jgi:hypothetical protein